MQGLPIDLDALDEGVAILLPCPDSDLVRLTTVGTHAKPAKRLYRLLRLNPCLLLFALASFQRNQHRPPLNARELVDWSLPNLFLELGRTELSQSKFSHAQRLAKRFRSSFDDFLQARSNQELQRSLSRLIQLICGLSKPVSRMVVSQLVGKNLNAKQFKSCKRLRRQKTASSVIRRWHKKSERNSEVGRLTTLAGLKFESEARFTARLHDEKMAAMKQLAYGASHEINNPLANIATRAQTMLSTESDHEKRHKLTVIYEQAMRAHEMISDMMLFAHPPAIVREHVSVRLLTARIVCEMKPELEQRSNLDLTVVMGAGVDQAFLDRTQFGVAIKCLIRNSIEALDASDEHKPQVQIRVAPSNLGELHFSIWDNGPPIAEEVVKHMFDPFYSGREAGRGLGFGLSKVWTIAKLHRGDLRYDDGVEYGTRFLMTLPAFQHRKSAESSTTLSIDTVQPGLEDAA